MTKKAESDWDRTISANRKAFKQIMELLEKIDKIYISVLGTVSFEFDRNTSEISVELSPYGERNEFKLENKFVLDLVKGGIHQHQCILRESFGIVRKALGVETDDIPTLPFICI